VARKLVTEGIELGGVWYRVKPFTNIGPHSRCQQCCSWGNIESKHGGKPVGGYCSGPHLTSDHKCNVVGCAAQPGSLCGHTQGKCPNCKGSHIAFSSIYAKETEATREARERRRKEPAGRTMQTTGPTTGANRIVLGLRTKAPEEGERRWSEEETADAEEGGIEAEDVSMAESTSPMATAKTAPTAAGKASAVVTCIELGNEAGDATSNV